MFAKLAEAPQLTQTKHARQRELCELESVAGFNWYPPDALAVPGLELCEAFRGD